MIAISWPRCPTLVWVCPLCNASYRNRHSYEVPRRLFCLIGVVLYIWGPVVVFFVLNDYPNDLIGVAIQYMGVDYFLLKLLFFLFDMLQVLDRLSLVFLFL